MAPDPAHLLEALEITTPLIGFYDTPELTCFPVTLEAQGCIFEALPSWGNGEHLVLTRDKFGCKGAGRWLLGVESLSRDQLVNFLANREGLKASPEIMAAWLDKQPTYTPRHDHLVIGPLVEKAAEFLRSVTFLVTPDQLSPLIIGAQYHSAATDGSPVIAPFAAGCMQLAHLSRHTGAEAVIGGTDIAMRHHLPPGLLLFTVTPEMFESLCALDEHSFLHKPFLTRLHNARKGRQFVATTRPQWEETR